MFNNRLLLYSKVFFTHLVLRTIMCKVVLDGLQYSKMFHAMIPNLVSHVCFAIRTSFTLVYICIYVYVCKVSGKLNI